MCGMAKKKLYIYTYTSVYMGYSYWYLPFVDQNKKNKTANFKNC